MVRRELRDLGVGNKRTFIGVVQDTGKTFKDSTKGKRDLRNKPLIQCCLTSVVDEETGQLITGHVWVAFYIRDFEMLNLKQGDIIRFHGFVKKYGEYNNETGIRTTGLDRVLKRKRIS